MERQGPLPSTSASVTVSSEDSGFSNARRVTSNQASGIQQLPDKVLEYIFGFLNVRALRQASDTCRGWRQIVGTYVEDNAVHILRRQRDRQPNSNQKTTVQHLPNEILTGIFSFLDFRALRQASNTCRLWRGIVAAYMGNAQLTLNPKLEPKPKKVKPKEQPGKGRDVPVHLNIYRTLFSNPDVLALAQAEPEVGSLLKTIERSIGAFTEEQTATSSSDQASKPEPTERQTGWRARLRKAIWGDSSPVKKKWLVPPEAPLWTALYGTVAHCIQEQDPLILFKAFDKGLWGAMRAFALWGADVNARNREKMTILGLACRSNLALSVGKSLALGARPDVRNGERELTPLHLVVGTGFRRRVGLVLELLRAGADPNICSKDPYGPYSPYETELSRALGSKEIREKHGLSALDSIEVLNALRNANLPFRKRLCLNEVSTPVFQYPARQAVALQKKNQLLKAVRIKVSKYYFLNLCEPPDCQIGWRPIHRAVWNINVVRLRYLLENSKVESHLPTRSGWKPLQLAVWLTGDRELDEAGYDACVQMVRMLAKSARRAGYSIDRQDRFSSQSKDCTFASIDSYVTYNCGVGDIPPIPGPLQLAVLFGRPELVKILCHYGADPHYNDGTLWGYTPFQFIWQTWPREVLLPLATQALGIHPIEQAVQSSEDDDEGLSMQTDEGMLEGPRDFSTEHGRTTGLAQLPRGKRVSERELEADQKAKPSRKKRRLE